MNFLTGEPLEYTVALIKPDAVEAGHAGEILATMERHFLVADVVCSKWRFDLAYDFYWMHSSKPFFGDLMVFMCSERIYAITLVSPDAVRRWRELMGATDSRKAEPGTIRERFGNKEGIVMRNAVHGSDSLEASASERRLLGEWIPRFGEEAHRLIEKYKNKDFRRGA